MSIINYLKEIVITVLVHFLLAIITLSGVQSVYRSFGGEFVHIHEVPYLVLILVETQEGVGKCTGSIISRTWVLSAGHCFPVYKDFKKIKIIAGIDDMDDTKDQQIRNPVKIIFHPFYRRGGNALKWDFALALVDKFVLQPNRVDILELGAEGWPQNEETYARKCEAVGWGLPDKNTKNNTRLHITKVTAEHGRRSCKCLKSYEKKRAVCLKTDPGKGICGGDSGGPLICNGKSYGVAHILYSLSKCKFFELPSSPECGGKSSVGVYSYICPELNWIKEHVESVPSRPESCAGTALFISIYLFLLICIGGYIL